MTLALTKNGETLCTADISTAQTKNDDFVNCLKSDKGTVQVNAGDVIRIAATAASGAGRSGPVRLAGRHLSGCGTRRVPDGAVRCLLRRGERRGRRQGHRYGEVHGRAAPPPPRPAVESYALKTAVDGVAVDVRGRRGRLHARRRCVRHHQDRDRGRRLLGLTPPTRRPSPSTSRSPTRRSTTCCTRPCPGGAGVALKARPSFTLKADSAARVPSPPAPSSRSARAPLAGASVNAATGEVTLTSTPAGAIHRAGDGTCSPSPTPTSPSRRRPRSP